MYNEILVNYLAWYPAYSRSPISITSFYLASPLCSCLSCFFFFFFPHGPTISNRKKRLVLCFYLEDLATLSLLPRTPTLDLLHVITILVHILGTNEGRRSKSQATDWRLSWLCSASQWWSGASRRLLLFHLLYKYFPSTPYTLGDGETNVNATHSFFPSKAHGSQGELDDR